jgi:4-hydroxybenzoate polyprenyltransferase
MARSTSSPVVNVAIPGARDAAPGRPVAVNLLLSLRPAQWTKNLLVFAGLLFGKRLFEPAAVGDALIAFAVFCALSGVVYVIIDIADRDSDRNHPLKALRPIASGALAAGTAGTAAALIGVAAIAAATLRGGPVTGGARGDVALQALDSGPLKHIVIIDVLTLAIGFVLRAVAGAVAVDVEISHWLLVCTVLLALFIALAKRRHEIVLLAGDAPSHRPILGEYSPYLLDQMIAVVTASTLIAYIFYTVSPETQVKFGTPWLGLTIPFPLYGIFRYLYLVHRREGGGSPADLLLTDRPLLLCVALWAVAVAVIIYRPV